MAFWLISSQAEAGASRTSNLAPPDGRFETRMRPRCDSTMSLAMYRPMPMPRSPLVDTNGSQIVRDAGGEPSHRAEPLEVEHLLVGGLDHRQRGGQLLGATGEQGDQAVD